MTSCAGSRSLAIGPPCTAGSATAGKGGGGCWVSAQRWPREGLGLPSLHPAPASPRASGADPHFFPWSGEPFLTTQGKVTAPGTLEQGDERPWPHRFLPSLKASDEGKGWRRASGGRASGWGEEAKWGWGLGGRDYLRAGRGGGAHGQHTASLSHSL